MFAWFKVLCRIAREENFVKEHESRVAGLQKNIENLKKQRDAYNADIEAAKAEVTKIHAELQEARTILRQVDQYMEETAKKIKSIQNTACQYTNQINIQVAGYEKQLVQYKQNLMQLQRVVEDLRR